MNSRIYCQLCKCYGYHYTNECPSYKTPSRNFRISKGRLAEPALHRNISMIWKGRELLGTIKGLEYCHARGAVELDVYHFNGEPWPIKPTISAVKLIE